MYCIASLSARAVDLRAARPSAERMANVPTVEGTSSTKRIRAGWPTCMAWSSTTYSELSDLVLCTDDDDDVLVFFSIPAGSTSYASRNVFFMTRNMAPRGYTWPVPFSAGGRETKLELCGMTKMEEALPPRPRAPRLRDVEACATLTKELAAKGRSLLKKQGEEVPPARKASPEESRAACYAYLDHCCKMAEIAKQRGAASTRRCRSPKRQRAARSGPSNEEITSEP